MGEDLNLIVNVKVDESYSDLLKNVRIVVYKNYGPSPIEAQKSLLGSAIQQSEKPEGQMVTNPSASLQE